MNLQKILISFIILFISLFSINISFGAINMTVSPIKYELTANTGATITKQAKLTNHTNKTIHIITGKSDFVANGEDGVPRFIRKSEVVYEQELSNWITIDTPEFDIAPEETKTINFTINIPDNATPGGHYGAVFFKNNNSEQSSGANVGINVDYGVLILLNINGEVNSEIEIGEPVIGTGAGNIKIKDKCENVGGDKSPSYYDGTCEANEKTNSGKIVKDDCIFDLTQSEYDGKCVDNIEEIVSEITGNIEDINIDTNNNTDDDNFKIDIKVPVVNKGNTHVKPTGKITLIDEDGKQIKKVGKKIITNDKGAIIGEQIVDYIPFNDQGGNILPGTKRVYDGSFKGFPYFEIVDGEKVLKYKEPGKYYTEENFKKHTLMYPWQRICTRDQNKKIKAKFNITYLDENGENIEYNSAKDFYIKYKEKYIGLNPYFFLALFILFGILFLLWFIFRKKKKRCINKDCSKKINIDMKICPYCGTKQSTKKNSKKPIIIATKKQKLKTKELEISEKIKNILIKNKLKYAEDISTLTKKEILEFKGIGEKALEEIKKALKKHKMKLKK